MFVLQAAVTQPSLIHKTVLAKSTPLARVWHHIYFHHSSSFLTDRRPFIRHSSSPPPLFGWLDWFTLLLLPPPKRSYHTEADSTLLITITHAHAATASDTSSTSAYLTYYDFFRHFGLSMSYHMSVLRSTYVPEVRTLESL